MTIGCRVVSFQVMRKQLELHLIIILVFTLIYMFSAAFRPLMAPVDIKDKSTVFFFFVGQNLCLHLHHTSQSTFCCFHKN